METETIIAAVVPIVLGAIAYGMQSKEVERLRVDLEESATDADEAAKAHRANISDLYSLHRAQEKEIATLRQGQDRLDRVEAAIDQLDRDSRTQGNQVAELSVKMGLVFEELRTVKHGINDMRQKIDSSLLIKMETEQKIDLILARMEAK
jgi:vacuolar-type H+-ATPase subunit I/STV1